MRVVSVSVGLPREVVWHGQTVLTSIFKTPVERRLRATTLNLEGDEQSDLTVHGGVDKAVYAYPAEHYEFWRRELPKMELPWGVFGENLTTEGLLESDVRIGDCFRVGSCELIVTQPRLPCFKLGIRFGRADILKRFLQSGRTGFYFSVALEGEVGAGDSIDSITKSQDGLTVAEVVNLYTVDANNQELLRRATQSSGLYPRAGKTTFARGFGNPMLVATDERSARARAPFRRTRTAHRANGSTGKTRSGRRARNSGRERRGSSMGSGACRSLRWLGLAK